MNTNKWILVMLNKLYNKRWEFCVDLLFIYVHVSIFLLSSVPLCLLCPFFKISSAIYILVFMCTCITVYMSFDECLNVFVDTLLSILLLHICFCFRISIVFISAFICCLLYNPASHLSLCSSLISRVPVSIFLV